MEQYKTENIYKNETKRQREVIYMISAETAEREICELMTQGLRDGIKVSFYEPKKEEKRLELKLGARPLQECVEELEDLVREQTIGQKRAFRK